tara:strand:- start:489 stop:959 length:471 start_codon:yes stop_codon:yes gene_type:complete
MKFVITFLVFLGLFVNLNSAYAASSGNDAGSSFYKSGKKLVIKAKKLEEKEKDEKAKKLYLRALSKLEKAYEEDKKNADILNYLGYALRKTGDFEKAEKFYLKGLELDAGHLGINEYLGELYVQTGRIELAKGRLQVLNGCNCEEYKELKELIEKN